MDALQAEISYLAPGLVVCSVPKNAVDATGSIPAWLTLPTGHKRSAELYLDGEYLEVEDPGLDELLWVVDEAERLILQLKAGLRNY